MLRFRSFPLLMLLGLSCGCTSASISNTSRTSTEQLLVANAVDQALDKVDFSTFRGHQVYLQDKYVDCVDKNYVIASTRHRLLTAGAQLVDAADKAEVVVELRAGAVGTNSAVSYIGTPEITLPGMMSIPEVRFVERKRQNGTAKLGVVAYDAKTNQALGTGGTTLARADDNNWFVAGVGPYQNGSVLKEVANSTSGPAAQPKTRVPIMVAFQPVGGPTDPADAPQFATTPEPEPQVSPAAHSSDFQPAWATSKEQN
ncbi:DUF6655 family protein [Planctomicrobium sp. SH664]|uniref:DUF6655 family protein n=1 Tax=Planctomicrobium sp. SH664 TaxID=3448125 RepID=UPI003F5B8893